VNIIGPMLRRIRDEPVLVERVRGELHLEAERTQVADSLLHAVWEGACPTPRGTDNANRVAALQLWGLYHTLLEIQHLPRARINVPTCFGAFPWFRLQVHS
jgi:hypothetical protein